MRVSYQTSRMRSGFTLVEVMVAAALSVVIMTIISYAFQVGLETTSQLKSIGGLADQLRTAHSIMRTDLRTPHLFEVGVGEKSINSLTGSWAGVNQQGFFRVSALTANAESGGATDGYGQGSALSNTSWLHFTVKLNATAPEDAFAAIAPSPTISNLVNDPANLVNLLVNPTKPQFASHWAEIAYFLEPMGTSTTIADPPPTTPPQTPLQLYTLRRRQRVIADQLDPSTSLSGVTANDYPELSIHTTPAITMNTPSSITQIGNRLNSGTPGSRPAGLPTATSISTQEDYRGSDIVLGNVISMRIMVLRGNSVEFADLGGDWDSATFATGPTLRAIRIQLRVYEPKNRLSRQITIDQAL